MFGILTDMNAQQANNCIRVAVPYYGSLSLPPLGLSRLFFVASVDPASRKVSRLEIQVWDPKKEPNIAVWMRTQGFSGVICSDTGSHCQVALKAENIWLLGKQEGEAVELVERWAATALDESGASRIGQRLSSWCEALQDNPILAM